ncbi:MAG: hypothetical protein PHO08_19290 [Methylococcales bacterium]|nr:hypothetical protein [Methylococcales bacterium]
MNRRMSRCKALYELVSRIGVDKVFNSRNASCRFLRPARFGIFLLALGLSFRLITIQVLDLL